MRAVWTSICRKYNENGLTGVLRALGGWFFYHGFVVPKWFFLHYWYGIIRRPRLGTFTFQGETYEYFYHPYNLTWNNERIVEIPIAQRFIEQAAGKRVLEVGNVLSHYFASTHDVVDKYERGRGVINEDIIRFTPSQNYDLILCVSTIEHVGWHEHQKEPEKMLAALQKMKQMLRSGGTLVVTMPIGENAFLDECLQSKRLPFTEVFFLKRISKDNEWREVRFDEVSDAKYDEPFPFTNALVIGIMRA